MTEIVRPKFKVCTAIKIAGNQNKLSIMLGINRASVNDWISSGRDYLPDFHSARMSIIYPEQSENVSDILKVTRITNVETEIAA